MLTGGMNPTSPDVTSESVEDIPILTHVMCEQQELDQAMDAVMPRHGNRGSTPVKRDQVAQRATRAWVALDQRPRRFGGRQGGSGT